AIAVDRREARRIEAEDARVVPGGRGPVGPDRVGDLVEMVDEPGHWTGAQGADHHPHPAGLAGLEVGLVALVRELDVLRDEVGPQGGNARHREDSGAPAELPA